jgi:hypothetical protein
MQSVNTAAALEPAASFSTRATRPGGFACLGHTRRTGYCRMNVSTMAAITTAMHSAITKPTG